MKRININFFKGKKKEKKNTGSDTSEINTSQTTISLSTIPIMILVKDETVPFEIIKHFTHTWRYFIVQLEEASTSMLISRGLEILVCI